MSGDNGQLSTMEIHHNLNPNPKPAGPARTLQNGVKGHLKEQRANLKTLTETPCSWLSHMVSSVDPSEDGHIRYKKHHDPRTPGEQRRGVTMSGTVSTKVEDLGGLTLHTTPP